MVVVGGRIGGSVGAAIGVVVVGGRVGGSVGAAVVGSDRVGLSGSAEQSTSTVGADTQSPFAALTQLA